MKRYIVVDDIFTRYTIVVDIADRTTSVHCDECDEWVVEYEGEQLSQHTRTDFFEMIVNRHDEELNGERIDISNTSKDLSSWLW